MNIKRNTKQHILALLAIGGLVVLPYQTIAQTPPVSPADNSFNRTADPNQAGTGCVNNPTACAEINAQIAENQQKLDTLNQQKSQYQQQIDQAQGEISTIQSQLNDISNEIALTEVNIQQSQTQIDSLQLQVKSLQLSIDEKNAQIEQGKGNLADMIRELDANSRTSTLSLVLQNNSFNEFFSVAQAQAQLGDSLNASITTIKQAKNDLVSKQQDVADLESQKQADQAQLKVQEQSAQQQADYKQQLLGDSKKSASQYQQLLSESVDESNQVNAAIDQLQVNLSQVLSGAAIAEAQQPSPKGFIWPISPGATGILINAYFHEPGYSNHQGIDLDADQGTPVLAAASGYAYRVSEPTSDPHQLSVFAIQHGGNIATLYLHLTAFAPSIKTGDYVVAGQVIGYSGGIRGTSGVGWCGSNWCSTGAHLHFQVNAGADLSKLQSSGHSALGYPVKPLSYLPSGSIANPSMTNPVPDPVND